jgi:hypothetical protein
MDANLMRSSRLQSTLDEREIAQFFHNSNMSDSPLSLARRGGTPSAPVAPIAHEPRFDPSVFGLAARHGAINTLDRVSAELPLEVTLDLGGSGKHDEAARVFIEPMHSEDRCPLARRTSCQQAGQQIGERRREEPFAALTKLGNLLGMTHGRQAGRFVHDDKMLIRIANGRPQAVRQTNNLGFVAIWRRIRQVHLHALSALKALVGIETRLAVDTYLMSQQEAACFRAR